MTNVNKQLIAEWSMIGPLSYDIPNNVITEQVSCHQEHKEPLFIPCNENLNEIVGVYFTRVWNNFPNVVNQLENLHEINDDRNAIILTLKKERDIFKHKRDLLSQENKELTEEIKQHISDVEKYHSQLLKKQKEHTIALWLSIHGWAFTIIFFVAFIYQTIILNSQ